MASLSCAKRALTDTCIPRLPNICANGFHLGPPPYYLERARITEPSVNLAGYTYRPSLLREE
eukprot:6173236-Pleurochrysis_carterae.AAC.2